MASREKRPLGPSKSKQKANNESVLPSTQNNRKRTQTTLKQQQLARDILEVVATGSQLSPKLEAALPRKKVLRSLRRKQKLRSAKANLINVKVTKKVPIKNLRRIAVDVKKGVKLKKVKRLVEADVDATSILEDSVENDEDDTENETTGKTTTKNNLRAKKTKTTTTTTITGTTPATTTTTTTTTTSRIAEETESVPSTERETTETSLLSTNSKNSPKTTRKLKNLESPESPSKSVKTGKNTTKRNASKERDIVKSTTTTRGIGKEVETTSNANKTTISNSSTSSATTGISPETKNSKKQLSFNSSIDLTIEEVVSSMLSDTENEDCQVVGGKLTRSRKMLIDEKIFTDVEIKKEALDAEETRSLSKEDRPITPQQETQTAIQLRNRSSHSFAQRSLRNGKLRQLSDSGVPVDGELKKRGWLNMDESNATESGTETSVDNVSDGNIDAESSFSESSGNDNQSNAASSKDETSPIKLDSPTDFAQVIDGSIELENNNNSERVDRGSGEVGPILRSKTKAKSTEIEIKLEDGETEEPRPLGRSLASQLEPRKSGSLDQLRKDGLTKIVDSGKPTKTRRSSLNIDVKKTMSSFYTNEKTENASKSQIDQMIENIKLTIAKSIESKIFGPEKSLVRSKNFEVPKIEEIVAPLSAESQKLGLDETTVEDDKPNASKSSDSAASNSSDNSLPKLADTAKEIEKLVMGDIELAETQNSESASVEVSRDEQQVVVEPRESTEANVAKEEDAAAMSQKSEKNGDESSSKESERVVEKPEETEISNDQRESKKSIVTRKSLRNKSSNESITDLDNSGKSTSSVDDNEKIKCDDGCDDAGKNDSSINVLKETSSSFVESSEITTKPDSPSQQKLIETESVPESSSLLEENPVTMDKQTAGKGNADPNISLNPEDSETLESISKEVERLVTEASTTSTIEKNNADVAKQETSKIEGSRTLEETSTINSSEKTTKSEKMEESKSAEASINDTTMDSTLPLHNESEIHTAMINADIEEEPTVAATKMHKTNCPDDSEETITTENSYKSPAKENSDRSQEIVETRDTSKSRNEKNSEEQKSAAEENRRVLRARDKLKRAEAKQGVRGTEMNETMVKVEGDIQQELDETQELSSEEPSTPDKSSKEPENPETSGILTIKLEEPDPPARTRRSREVKRRKEELTQQQNTLKNKRSRKDVRKSDQQNKEETLLDNEVATINENNRSLVDKYDKVLGGADNLRGFSEGGRGPVEKLQDSGDNNRSKSENDIDNVKNKSECGGRLSRQRAESDTLKESENVDEVLNVECKITKTPETPQKDSDDASTSGESSSSLTLGSSKLDETPEDKVKKESILRLLGLEPLEKAAERLNHQKARKEQYTGTLKTVIRVQKDKDKKRSRSPLKMVLKQGRGDGDGDSPEFYTIQKEFGTSGLGDSSSGANRKFSTNHRHSCDEDNEEAPPKDRQSLVIPEKSSSFSIHPGRLCADVCCYCFGKFGSLDTPMHLAQMKSDERRQKILSVEKHLNKDSCLCDACYRHVDRRANTSPTNMQSKPQRQHRQLMVSKCSARDCREPARHHIKRRWLLKVKAVIHHQVDINWESSQHTSMSFCVDHYSKIEPYLTCALCKRRLAKNHTHPLAAAETDELNQRLGRQGIPVHLVAGTFVCKLCRYFTQLQLKYKQSENMNAGHKNFCKTYRIRILHCHDIEVFEAEEDDASPGTSKDKEKRKKVKCTQNKSIGMSKSPDAMTNNSRSEKSTPEPVPKNLEIGVTETDSETSVAKTSANETVVSREVQLLDLESTVEKLKKRKAMEQLVYTSEPSTPTETRGSDVIEILAMDKEVTLTRLPKRPRVSSDITPVVQRLGANPSISVRTLFPGEEEMNLHANVEFANVREVTPQGWEKCATMIQYDRDTKILWQELQRPYGNQSSFLRHLILLEKYYRSGDLVLAPNASRNAINYSTSVQNRLISYEGPEKMDEPIMEPISSEYNSSRRLSGGYVMERDRLSLPSTSSLVSSVASKSTTTGSNTTSTNTSTSTSTSTSSLTTQTTMKAGPPRVLKLTSGVSIIKKPPPSLQRLGIPSGSSTNGGNVPKRKEPGYPNKIPVTSGGKVFQLSENEFRRLQNLKKQKQLLSELKQQTSSPSGSPSTQSPGACANATVNLKATTALATQYQKAQIAAQTQFQKHLRMQQEMLNRQSRGDFEPLICDVRSLMNENTPTQNLLNTLNLPKSIQVTTKPPNPIPILPKIPKSLTVIPQTVSRPLDK